MNRGLTIGVLVLNLSLFLATAALSDQQLNVNVPGGSAQDMLNMTTIPSEISDSNGDPSMQRFCTNPSGRIIRQGQPGYQQCLEEARGKKPTNAVTPTAQTKDGSTIEVKSPAQSQ